MVLLSWGDRLILLPFLSEMESASIAAAFGAGNITWFPLGEHGTSGISCILSCSLMCVSVSVIRPHAYLHLFFLYFWQLNA